MNWQPIETAPKDGTEILVYKKDVGRLIVVWGEDDAWAETWEFHPVHDITHWMPLPEPPND